MEIGAKTYGGDEGLLVVPLEVPFSVGTDFLLTVEGPRFWLRLVLLTPTWLLISKLGFFFDSGSV